jgi:sigma-B regulation protein RsbU (phosphoserine phosphatase)
MRSYVEERSPPLRSHLLLGLIFGLFSIYGTLSGIPLMGAVVNIRDAGPLVAGLAGGTVPGLLAGLIGGSHRLLMGLLDWERLGFTCFACSVSTVLIGLISGLIHRRWGVVRPVQAAVIAAVSEAGHMALGVLIAGRPEQMLRPETMRFAWNNIVRQAAAPMIIANTVGVGVFFAAFFLYRRELEAYRQRDAFYREVEQRNVELRSVYEITQTLTASSIDPDETLQTILQRVQQMMAYDRAEVCFYTPEEKSLQVQGEPLEGT